jgi:hypothetical protein
LDSLFYIQRLSLRVALGIDVSLCRNFLHQFANNFVGVSLERLTRALTVYRGENELSAANAVDHALLN